MRHDSKRPGLILLVVLGMLALFSMLSVTYVVFANQSRSASVALARKDIRGNKSRIPLFEEAVRQLIRGSSSDTSMTYGHSLLGDLYGENESTVTGISTEKATRLQIRDWSFDAVDPIPATNPQAVSPLGYNANDYQRPMIIGGHFLRIPLDPGGYGDATRTPPLFPNRLPTEHDALNGRIVTFPDGNGPLSGLSFHIVRYIGQMPTYTSPVSAADQMVFAQCYSITIDLLENDLSKSITSFDPGLGRMVSQPILDWVAAFPPGGGNGVHQAGVYACYDGVQIGGARRLSNGYELFLNAIPLNSHGYGVYNDGSSQSHVLFPPTHAMAGTSINSVATGLLPNLEHVGSVGSLSPAGGFIGDSDEPYDAADYANWFLSYRNSGASTSADIIPSFHRASLINYLVNWKDPQDPNYQPSDLNATLQRIQMAVGRPLAMNVVVSAGPDSFTIVQNPTFTGSNAGGVGATPRLEMQINQWTDWPTVGLPAFRQWLTWLTQGPWDVDNDLDGVPDSMFVDVGLPLETSADGKLLKALVAYYVEDLDRKLDINAIGSLAQANANNYASAIDGEFARYDGANALFLPQGMGYGPAELSFRHLLAKAPGYNPPNVPGGTQLTVQNQAYLNILRARYLDNPRRLVFLPGTSNDDAASHMRMREWYFMNGANLQSRDFSHARLPALPLGSHGRAMVALDRLGNPRIRNVDNNWFQTRDDPYESRLKDSPFQDSPFTPAEWERLYRIGDSDRSALPRRLEQLFGELPTTVASSTLRHEITPLSSHLRVPYLASRGPSTSTIPVHFMQLVNTIRDLQPPAGVPAGQRNIPLLQSQPYRGFASLFPLEFLRAEPMDVNRPFGNGVDDDNDGQIDEPAELYAFFPEQPVYATGVTQSNRITSFVNYLTDYLQGQTWSTPTTPPIQPFDPNQTYNNTSPSIFEHTLETRQLYARHLYCLAQLLIPEDYAFPNVDRSTYDALNANDKRELRARILAQWAVNVVDFRDADAAMTRFPYDPDPLRPKGSGTNAYYGWEAQDGFVVWGMEQPELLLTETLATHDLRIKRDAQANPARYNQYRLPLGSLFLELYCPRTTSTNNDQQTPGVPSSLYNNASPIALDLGRLAPAGPNGVTATPVWRIYISDPQDPTEQSPLSKYNQAAEKHHVSYQLPESNHRFSNAGALLPNAAQNADDSGMVLDRSTNNQIPDVDTGDARVVVFASGFTPTVDNCPGVSDPGSQVFVNQFTNRVLQGGQYLVVGPRTTTSFGSKLTAWPSPTGPVNRPSNHRLIVNGTWAKTYKTDVNDPNYDVPQRNTMRNCVTMVAASRVPSSWQGNNSLRQSTGLNVSEPLAKDSGYYQRPSTTVNPNDNSTDPDNGAVGFGHANFRDDAFHDYSGGPPSALDPFDDGNTGPLQEWLPGPNAQTNAVNVGTQENWCTAYLQRLADPEKPWDAAFNPYITVDWMPIDLTVFSGEENHADVYPANPPQGQEIRFASRQKTGHMMRNVGGELRYDDTNSTTDLGRTFYSAATHAPRETTAIGLSQTFFDYEMPMDERAGSIANPIRPTAVDLRASTDAGHVNQTFSTFGFLNSTFRIAGEEGSIQPGSFLGAPADPAVPDQNNMPTYGLNQQWIPDSLYWANRDFVHPYEIAMVPLSGPGQIMQEFAAMDDLSGTASRYDTQQGGSQLVPFPHVLPFFGEYDSGNANVPMASMFDMLETASPWADANEHIDPTTIDFQDPTSVAANQQPIVTATNSILVTRRAPYNRMSRYVEAGRVNLNTIAEQNVLQGLWYNTLTPAQRRALGGGSGTTGAWNTLVANRRGYAPGGGTFNLDPARLNSDYPTQFAGIFKPPMEASMVPATRGSSLDSLAADKPANVTLLREDSVNGANSGGPMLHDTGNNLRQRNSLTDMYPITRLGNLTTNRSNVFAVYTTIAFFEYDEENDELLQEYGADKGEAERFRAFYIIDRSKPVGFEPGVDHNVEKTIIVKRYLDVEQN